MNSVQIRTTVHDYDGWKAAFDKGCDAIADRLK